LHSTNYLYGIEPKELDNKMYWEALQYKLEAGTRLYRKLFLIPKRNKEEEDRMFYVDKAYNHTKKLLEERNIKD